MDRLTEPLETSNSGFRYKLGEWAWIIKPIFRKKRAINRLGAYEDTGLTPEEIMDGKMLTGWIPVEEQMPEYAGQYLVCFDDEFVATASYETDRDGQQDWELWADSGEVIAWMRVPEPYKTEEDQS